jgi:hypothetical protein
MPFIRASEAGKLSRPSKFGTTRPFLSDDRIAELLDMKAEDDAQSNFQFRMKQKWDSMMAASSTVINGPPNPWSVPANYIDPEGAVSLMTPVNDDITRMVDLAFRWCILGDATAAQGAAAFLNAYSNLTFLSAYPDRADGSRLGWSGRWPCFIQAAMMISDSEHYTEALHGRLQTVTDNGLILSTGTLANMAYHNWSGWGLVHDFAVATFLNDRSRFNTAIQRWCSAVDQQLKPLTGVRGTKAGVLIQNVPYKEVFRQQNQQGDGSYGLYYSMFALNGLTVAAEWARIGGEYLYDYVCPTGQSLYGFWQTVASWMADPGDYPFDTSSDGVPTEISRLQGFVDILHSIWPEVLDGLDPSTNAATPFLPDVMRTKTTTQDYYGFRGGILGYRDRRLCFNY